jgi:uncharacterized protein involved in exopolysaccharide biosynthesis
MNAAAPDDISAVWRALRASLPKLLMASLAIGAIAFAALAMIAPRYTSEARIEVVPSEREGKPADSTAMHLRALTSPDLAAKISAQEGLANKPEFNSALEPPTLINRIRNALDRSQGKSSERDRVLQAFFDRLDVYSPKQSRFIGIKFSSDDPKLAADVANRIAGTYRTSLAARAAAATEEVQKALQPQIDKLMQEATEAEAAVERFRGQANGVEAPPTGTGLNQQQPGDLTAELAKAQAARTEAEARAQSVRDIVKAGNTETLPDVQKSPLIQNLLQQRVRLERQLSELSATLLPGHPRMRQIQADLAGLERQIKAEVGKIVEGVEKEASAAAMREAAVKQSIEDLKAGVVGTPDHQARLRELEAVAKSKRAELERLQARYEADRARAASRAVPNQVQIISNARPASVPSFPDRLPYAALVAVAVLLFGIAIVATKAVFTASRTPKVAWSPAAAGLVRTGTPTSRAEPSAAKSVGAISTVDSVNALAGELLVRPPDIGGFRTLITGETDGVDCGPEAVELARTLADSGCDVMLVDWSLDGHGIAESLGLRSRPGFAELLLGESKFEDVVSRMPHSSAQMIAAGGGAVEPEDLLDPDQLNLALDALDTAYDHIIVVGRMRAARALFEAIQGRFDAGVIVADENRRAARLPETPGTFLGFEVTDIELFRLERPASGRLAAERLARLMTKGSAEARAAS